MVWTNLFFGFAIIGLIVAIIWLVIFINSWRKEKARDLETLDALKSYRNLKKADSEAAKRIEEFLKKESSEED